MTAERGVSSVLGVVMILGITLAAITSMLMIGAFALETTQQDTELSQMETSMAQMSSKASLVALGDAGNQQFNLGSMNNGDLEIREDAGNVTIEYVNGTDIPDEQNLTEIYHTDQFGALVYTNGDREVAYQGGGVWKRTGQDGGEMISPPEYHYLSETLTFPIIRVTGEGVTSTGGSGEIAHEGSDSYYPNETMSNPLDNATVFVEIESDYHRGWYQFFDSRTEGNISHDPDNKTIRAELTALHENRFSSAVTVSDSTNFQGHPDIETYEEGTTYPSPTSEIENKIAECGGNDLPEFDGSGGKYNESMYCASGDDQIEVGGDLNFTTDEQTDVILPNGIDLNAHNIEISGEGTVRFFVSNEFEFGGGDQKLNYIEGEPDPSKLFFYVHSEAQDIVEAGNTNMHGVMYAPGVTIDLRGDVDFVGTIIADTFKARGGVSVGFDDSLDGTPFEFEATDDELRYLHITENVVEVKLD